MKKFITFLFLSVFTVPVYCATDCITFDPGGSVSGREWVKNYVDTYFYCGEHAGDDYGCPNNADVYAIGSMGWGIYTCYTNGPDWAYNNPNRWIADCTDDPATEAYNHESFCNGNDYVYFADYTSGPSYSLMNICKISRTDVASYMTNCESSGGSKLYCETNCLCDEGQGKKNKTDYECECIDSDAHLEDRSDGSKVCVKGNFYPCVTDADCLGGRTPVKPSHSTAWRCVNQKYKVKVCAATDCETGYHIALDENNKSKGFCEQDAVDDEEVIEEEVEVIEEEEIEDPFEDPSGGNPEPPKRTKSVTINCNSIPETIPQNGRCVCRDKNKKIQGNKCEYTAEYFASITADIEKKYKHLTTLVAGFGKSVWRDKDGNFNTARLASDSVAGVVLGTVGGVVTAHLVKKAQVKQGFEDMKCSIGGQPVASYGDSFVVGQ